MILKALIKKEILQIFRDPSSILIAFVLPLILLFVYGYGVSLDNSKIRLGLVLEDSSPALSLLVASFEKSPAIELTPSYNRKELEYLLNLGYIRGIVIVPFNFTRLLNDANIQLITDGSEPNIASFLQNYVQGVLNVWLASQNENINTLISVESRFWYNPELKSRNFLIPGSIVITMTLIGTLLTALVIAREWERGTMESILATPISVQHIILGKLIPYFILGLCSMAICFIVATIWYQVPFRGSFLALTFSTSIFLLAALGQGLLISSLAKDQFIASQVALMSAFLPAFMLSGFIFEISAMPSAIQFITHVFAAKYFIKVLQTLFLAGNIMPVLVKSSAAMLLIAIVFFILTIKKTNKIL